jgi:hypothetical protein
MEKLKQLRERTGAGITDCKKALDEAQGDITLAIEILRKKGISKAAKRSARSADEGIIKFVINDEKTKGYMLELNSESDSGKLSIKVSLETIFIDFAIKDKSIVPSAPLRFLATSISNLPGGIGAPCSSTSIL